MSFLQDDLADPKEATKPWVYPIQKYSVELKCPEDISAWKRLFPDPANSPFTYTSHLRLLHAKLVTAEDASWIRRWFTNVVRLEISIDPESGDKPMRDPFSRFHNLSPTVRCLSICWSALSTEQVFELVCSFPLLEDLRIIGWGGMYDKVWDAPRHYRLPGLSGTLELGSMVPDFMFQLLEHPSRLSFRKIVWREGWRNEYLGVNELVRRCSDTLEYVHIEYRAHAGPIDLSKAKKLKKVEFRFDANHAGRVAGTLNTIMSENEDFELDQVYPPFCPWDTTPAHFGGIVDDSYSQCVDFYKAYKAYVRLEGLPQTRVEWEKERGGSDAGPCNPILKSESSLGLVPG